MKWKLSIGNEDYSMPVVTTSSSSPSVVTDDQLSKKARASKAAKARLLNLAALNCGSEATTKKSKPPKLVPAGPALSDRIDKMPHIPVIPSTTPIVLNRAKNPAVVPLVRNDAMISCSSTSIPKSTFEDVQAVIRDGDVMEERIKQDARIKIAAAREQSRIEMEVAKQKAAVLADAIALEAQRVIGLQIVAKEQAVLNARNDGTIKIFYYLFFIFYLILCAYAVQPIFRSKRPELIGKLIVQMKNTKRNGTVKRKNIRAILLLRDANKNMPCSSPMTKIKLCSKIVALSRMLTCTKENHPMRTLYLLSADI